MKKLYLIAFASLSVLTACSDEQDQKYPDKKLTKEECYRYEEKHHVDLDCNNNSSPYLISTPAKPAPSSSSSSIKSCALIAKGSVGGRSSSGSSGSKPSLSKPQKSTPPKNDKPEC